MAEEDGCSERERVLREEKMAEAQQCGGEAVDEETPLEQVQGWTSEDVCIWTANCGLDAETVRCLGAHGWDVPCGGVHHGVLVFTGRHVTEAEEPAGIGHTARHFGTAVHVHQRDGHITDRLVGQRIEQEVTGGDQQLVLQRGLRLRRTTQRAPRALTPQPVLRQKASAPFTRAGRRCATGVTRPVGARGVAAVAARRKLAGAG